MVGFSPEILITRNMMQRKFYYWVLLTFNNLWQRENNEWYTKREGGRLLIELFSYRLEKEETKRLTDKFINVNKRDWWTKISICWYTLYVWVSNYKGLVKWRQNRAILIVGLVFHLSAIRLPCSLKYLRNHN